MANFAKLDDNNIVLQINSVSDNELLDENGVLQEERGIAFLIQWSGGYQNWKQTCSDNTFRKNYAGIGFKYDSVRDAFIPPKPYNSWILNEETCRWDPPVPYPADGGLLTGKFYSWNEETQTWVLES